jgi:hypothetical protein
VATFRNRRPASPARVCFIAICLCLGLCSFAAVGSAAAEGTIDAGASSGPAEGGDRPPCSWLLGMSRGGGTGLYGLPLADPGCPWQLRLGVLGYGFFQYNFLLVDDRNEQMSIAVQLSATIGPHAEVWLQTGTQANRNQRPTTDPGSGMQPTLSLGRTSFGVKLHSAWGRLGHVALQPLLRIGSGPFDFGPSFSSLDAGVDLLGSLDLSAVWPRLPLRLSLRAGYLYDRSAMLIAGLDCMALGGAECLAARLVYTTAYDIGQPRVELGLGADARFRIGGRFMIGPTLSYAMSVVTSDGDPVLRAQLAMQAPQAPQSDVEARVAQRLHLGARLLLPWAVAVDFGLQMALSSFGYAMGPKQPQVAGFGSLSFALDLGGPAASAGRAVAGRPAGSQGPPAAAPAPAVGKLAGVVRDAATKLPLADAVVRFIGASENALLTGGNGAYKSAPLPAGPITIEASRGDHQTARVAMVVHPGETVTANLDLFPLLRPSPAILWLELRDEAGVVPQALATLSRPDKGPGRAQPEAQRTEQIVEMSPQPGGLYARLPGGSWRLRVDAFGYLSREQVVVLPAGAERRLPMRLLRRPQIPRVRLGSDAVMLAEPLSFVDDGERRELEPASRRLLDEVGDLIIHHPEVRQVRIEAVGPCDEAQLIAVRDHLLEIGIAPERVIAVEAPGEPRREKTPRIMLRVVR